MRLSQEARNKGNFDYKRYHSHGTLEAPDPEAGDPGINNKCNRENAELNPDLEFFASEE